MKLLNLFLLVPAATVAAISSSWIAPANASIAYETITTTAFTTYCPEATVFAHGNVVYTVTEATTLVITDCPCTITRPIQTLTPTTLLYTSCPPSPTAAPPNTWFPWQQGPNSAATTAGVVYTQTVTNANGGQVTVTQTGTPTPRVNGGAAAGTGSGVGSATGAQFTGAAAGRKGAEVWLGGLAVLGALAL
ncbi:uncharacterized protein LY89DRAFT_257229 [Mollisia scopiformis]|uniref:Clock-controlled protein 6 n=1 Tax=Mollisia scopiformis TaxID=149040 RepID=A0A132BD48_MOLSC|nr:uncharacterized protein LY89DRAFT_257229 [Mollisia scopiformis]KUJ10308.1 hypothetical protein LY89DRAFT_257229 [Mollisia scopiformis]